MVVIHLKIFFHVMRAVPISGFISLLSASADGLFISYVTWVTIRLFNSVSSDLLYGGDRRAVYFYGGLIIIGYGAKQLLLFVSSIAMNAGVYEKVNNYSAGRLYSKASKIPLIDYEKADILDMMKRAESCVAQDVLSQLFLSGIRIVFMVVGIVSAVAILAEHSLIFIPIGIISILPYLVIRVVRGQKFYNLAYYSQSK